MSFSIEKNWMQRARFLTQALILSGTLNIGFFGAFIYQGLKDKFASISYEVPSVTSQLFTNEQVLRSYSKASFQDLLIRLESKDLIEDGYAKRDLALACLSSFHHFHVEKALGGISLQKRMIAFRNAEGDEMVELLTFAGLKDEHFEALLQFARTEKWPLTPKGLFFEISRTNTPYDPSLLDAFYCTTEFHSLYCLLQKSILDIQPGVLLSLLKEGTWAQIKKFSSKLRLLQSYNTEMVHEFLTSYALESKSKLAAGLLLEHEMEYVLKRFDDVSLESFLDLLTEEKTKLRSFALQLLVSQRSDALREKAASILYVAEGGVMPDPYDYLTTLYHFFPEKAPGKEIVAEASIPLVGPAKITLSPVLKKGIIHKVQAGESLWKISRKYGCKMEAIMKLNKLETDRLRVGRELQIPEGKI